MRNTAIARNERGPLAADNPLKVTALLYFKEALEGERYEDCAGLVQAAKELGVEQSEISELLAGYVRALAVDRQNEANQRNRNRWRF